MGFGVRVRVRVRLKVRARVRAVGRVAKVPTATGGLCGHSTVY